jgi:cation transport ATPase
MLGNKKNKLLAPWERPPWMINEDHYYVNQLKSRTHWDMNREDPPVSQHAKELVERLVQARLKQMKDDQAAEGREKSRQELEEADDELQEEEVEKENEDQEVDYNEEEEEEEDEDEKNEECEDEEDEEDEENEEEEDEEENKEEEDEENEEEEDEEENEEEEEEEVDDEHLDSMVQLSGIYNQIGQRLILGRIEKKMEQITQLEEQRIAQQNTLIFLFILLLVMQAGSMMLPGRRLAFS